MKDAVFVLTSITIAAVIGYVTNYLAIKMLFHPRRAWTIRGRRVPFTPGLIPKRKGEIAVALGRVVSEYLVTADGLKKMLQQPEVRGQVEHKLYELVEKWARSEETIEQIAAQVIGVEATERAKQELEQLARELLASGIRGLWAEDTASSEGEVSDGASAAAPVAADESNDLGADKLAESSANDNGQAAKAVMHRPLAELLQQLQIPLAELIERQGVPWFVTALRQELASANGMLLIRKIVTQMLDSLGGMMGMLAGMFLDEDKIAIKVRDAILSYLDTPAAWQAVAGILNKQTGRLNELTPAMLIGKLREQMELQDEKQEQDAQPEDSRMTDAQWVVELAERVVPLGAWLERAWRLTPQDLLKERKDTLMKLVPALTDRLVATAADNIDQAVRTVNLSKLVQKQVEDFPIEQVEQVILSITGREFKAITWLGALLGGLIGIFQVLFYMLLG